MQECQPTRPASSPKPLLCRHLLRTNDPPLYIEETEIRGQIAAAKSDISQHDEHIDLLERELNQIRTHADILQNVTESPVTGKAAAENMRPVIGAKVDHLENELQHLRGQRDDLRGFIESYNTILHPARRLPSELIT